VYVQFLLAAESTKFISVMSFAVKNSTKEESVQSPDRFVSNGNYRLLFRSLSEALQIAKCFEQAYMQLPLHLHREKRCILQSKNGVNINKKIIFLKDIYRVSPKNLRSLI
jgi:hypothetical protein